MTITDFTTLTLADQLEYLYAEGVYLSKRDVDGAKVILYQVNQLYVEIFYTDYRRTVSRIQCSGSTDVLNAYLETISIAEAFI